MFIVGHTESAEKVVLFSASALGSASLTACISGVRQLTMMSW